MKNNNLIAISGKISSGKDTVAQIIQFLSFTSTLQKNNLELIGNIDHRSIFNNWTEQERFTHSGFEIKRFAGKLKQIISILTGYSLEDLEKEEIKSTQLPEEWSWWYFKRTDKIVYIEDILPFHYSNISDIEMFKRRFAHIGGDKLYSKPMTVRELLQKVGTDAMRSNVHANVWINALFSDYKFIKNPNPILRSMVYPKWIIPDLRFVNEFEAIKSRGGITIRVERDYDKNDPKYNHSSETSLDDKLDDFDYIIDNTHSMEYLIESVKLILEAEKII